MSRKPIQLLHYEGNFVGDNVIVLVALCDDGSIWSLYDPNRTWYKLPSIPNDDEDVFNAASDVVHIEPGEG